MQSEHISIVGTGCSTATGESVPAFMAALESGADVLVPVPTTSWKIAPKPDFEPRAFRWKDRGSSSVRALLGRKLQQVFAEAIAALPLGAPSMDTLTLKLKIDVFKKDRIGVLLASTKGFTEDFIWNETSPETLGDSLTPLLDDFISATDLKPVRKLCVSNACTSSLAALYVARTWLRANRVDHVVVLACDAIDSFVLHGFHQLRVLSPDRTRPFSGSRTGFHLGDAAACVILSKKLHAPAKLFDARVDSEGHAATRPSHSGESLLRAARSLDSIASRPPELVIAHGTSTQTNDITEDRVLTALFAEADNKPAITGTKWSIGHTLGAAGLLDVIAAVEVLKSQRVFSIFTTAQADAAFQSSYLVHKENEASSSPLSISRVLVTSLGFGGVHAAALVGST